jgi:hypothetical protein
MDTDPQERVARLANDIGSVEGRPPDQVQAELHSELVAVAVAAADANDQGRQDWSFVPVLTPNIEPSQPKAEFMVGGLPVRSLHADLTMLAWLSLAVTRARVVRLAG